jgi:hypothetical protein
MEHALNGSRVGIVRVQGCGVVDPSRMSARPRERLLGLGGVADDRGPAQELAHDSRRGAGVALDLAPPGGGRSGVATTEVEHGACGPDRDGQRRDYINAMATRRSACEFGESVAMEEHADRAPAWSEEYAAARRQTTEQSMWQLPGMSVAAQAFLYSQGLNPAASGAARVLVSSIGFITALATAQILVHQNDRLQTWRLFLHASRAQREAPPIRRGDVENTVRCDPEGRAYFDHLEKSRRWRVAKFVSPVSAWLYVLAAFAFADVLVLVVGIAEIAGLWDPF